MSVIFFCFFFPQGTVTLRRLSLAEGPVHLGDLYGNRFEIIVRCHNDEDKPPPPQRHKATHKDGHKDGHKDTRTNEDPVPTATAATAATAAVLSLLQSRMKCVQSHGFLNYYGLQRLGNSNISSWRIGQCVLKQQYNRAVLLVRAKTRNKTKNLVARSGCPMHAPDQNCTLLTLFLLVLSFSSKKKYIIFSGVARAGKRKQ
jgi:hypothetical protein